MAESVFAGRVQVLIGAVAFLDQEAGLVVDRGQDAVGEEAVDLFLDPDGRLAGRTGEFEGGLHGLVRGMRPSADFDQLHHERGVEIMDVEEPFRVRHILLEAEETAECIEIKFMLQNPPLESKLLSGKNAILSEDPAVLMLSEKILQDYLDSGPGADEAAKAYLLAILNIMARKKRTKDPESVQKVQPPRASHVQRPGRLRDPQGNVFEDRRLNVLSEGPRRTARDQDVAVYPAGLAAREEEDCVRQFFHSGRDGIRRASSFSTGMVRSMSVSMKPGSTALTVMFFRADSSASVLVKPLMAALDAA